MYEDKNTASCIYNFDSFALKKVEIFLPRGINMGFFLNSTKIYLLLGNLLALWEYLVQIFFRKEKTNLNIFFSYIFAY